ncbi:uncharacterized protein LDX57_002068 [Aspergillus melleus]|uniref:uncharacterized protein n=1 Tax=Aspergillus melleus TaxID=138277 RepID=UPI001E8D41F3|nr:uncharacterized protein LDX57_002068 [Aspergillus melleus]KAH8424317.1 hypothetical protein LDX57_002068 [Aspergillus melleus]
MNVNMNLNMDSNPHPFNQPASSTAPYATIPSATAPTTATHPPSNPLLFSSSTSARTTTAVSTTNPTLNPNPHHAPADPLHHLQQQPHTAETGSSGLAPAAAAAVAECQTSAPALQHSTSHYPHQIEGAGGPTATAPFLRDFSLVAEAAKRAQMSVVMRDLESVTL